MSSPRGSFYKLLALSTGLLSPSVTRQRDFVCDSEKPRVDPSGLITSFPVAQGSAPFWTTRKSASTSPPATRSSVPDSSRVVVIGAGMSGSSAAMHLAQQGVTVTLLDTRGVSDGATGRNGGFLFPPAVATLCLAALSGKGIDNFTKAAELLVFERDNRRAIRKFAHDRAIACELDHDIDVYQLFDSRQDLKEKMGFLWPLRTLSRLAGVDVLCSRGQLCDALNIPDEGPWAGGLRIRGGADTFCAADVAKQCVVDAVSAGADWLPETCVISLEEDSDGTGVTVVTGSGRLRCEKVIVATNAYIPALVPSLEGCITPVRNHVGVTTVAPSLNKSNIRCGISADDGFVYLHQRPDGRIILGGFRNLEDGKGVNEPNDSIVVDHVAESVKKFIPSRFTLGKDVHVDQVWTGIIGWSCDDAPWVGPVPHHPNILVCGGFSGHGLTQTFLCGQAVAAMAIGQKPPFFPHRFLPSLDRKKSADLDAGHRKHSDI